MLNSTLTATSRTLCAILENYQTDKGVEVPVLLRPYLGGLDFIPFVQAAPEKEEEEPAADKKQGKKGEKKKDEAKAGST